MNITTKLKERLYQQGGIEQIKLRLFRDLDTFGDLDAVIMYVMNEVLAEVERIEGEEG